MSSVLHNTQPDRLWNHCVATAELAVVFKTPACTDRISTHAHPAKAARPLTSDKKRREIYEDREAATAEEILTKSCQVLCL